MLDLGFRRYGEKFDYVSTEAWFRNIVLKSPMVFLPIRSIDAFCITIIAVLPWLPSDWEANVLMLCADNDAMWQAIGLLRASAAWAKKRKCTEWRISSETVYDLAPIARRLGAEELTHRYRLRL